MRVKELATILRDEINQSDLQPGSPIASARELAQQHHTSVLTAHRAINILVDEGLLYRIQGSGSFIAETAADEQHLSLGLCFAKHHGDPVATYAAFDVYEDVIAAKLRRDGHHVNRFNHSDLLDAAYIKEQLQQLDGFIISSACLDANTSLTLEQSGLPVVEVQHEEAGNHPFHQVIPHLLPGFKQMLQHLQAAGHHKFIIAANYRHGHQGLRIDAIYDAARQLGIDKSCFEEVYTEIKLGDHGRMSGQELGEKILNQTTETCPVIITISDFVAFGIMDVILRKSLKPGIDVVLTSYDDLESDGFLPFIKPVISSVCNHKKESAREAVATLLDTINTPTKYSRIVRIPTSFIIRQSSTGQND